VVIRISADTAPAALIDRAKMSELSDRRAE